MSDLYAVKSMCGWMVLLQGIVSKDVFKLSISADKKGTSNGRQTLAFPTAVLRGALRKIKLDRCCTRLLTRHCYPSVRSCMIALN